MHAQLNINTKFTCKLLTERHNCTFATPTDQDYKFKVLYQTMDWKKIIWRIYKKLLRCVAVTQTWNTVLCHKGVLQQKWLIFTQVILNYIQMWENDIFLVSIKYNILYINVFQLYQAPTLAGFGTTCKS